MPTAAQQFANSSPGHCCRAAFVRVAPAAQIDKLLAAGATCKLLRRRRHLSAAAAAAAASSSAPSNCARVYCMRRRRIPDAPRDKIGRLAADCAPLYLLRSALLVSPPAGLDVSAPSEQQSSASIKLAQLNFARKTCAAAAAAAAKLITTRLIGNSANGPRKGQLD